MIPSALQPTLDALLPGLEVDEATDTVTWSGGTTGLHDYAALYAVPGLYDAVYLVHLRGGSPQLLADLLADVDPALATRRVLDVGCGTGAVGTALRGHGVAALHGVDLEPEAAVAVRRDRPGTYDDVRALDLLRPTDDDAGWLRTAAPDVVTVVAAVGFGHLPHAAFEVLTDLLPADGLLAVTVAADLDEGATLALLTGPRFARVGERRGVHRVTADGRPLEVTALVLRRT